MLFYIFVLRLIFGCSGRPFTIHNLEVLEEEEEKTFVPCL